MQILLVLAFLLVGFVETDANDSLAGHNLLLTRSADGTTQRLIVTSKDSATTLGDGNFSADDPVLHQAALTLRTATRNHTMQLRNSDYGGWTYIGAPGANRGYRYRNPVEPGLSVKISPGKGFAVRHRRFDGPNKLQANPEPVSVRLTIGAHSYCLEFGGQQKFVQNRSFKALKSDSATHCP